MTIAEAKKLLLSNLRTEQTCPCCTKRAKIDERPLTGGMAQSLLAVYHYFKQNPSQKWIHAPSFLHNHGYNRSNDFGLLRYWKLIVPALSHSDTGSKFTGIYGITPLGVDFVEGRVKMKAKVGLFARTFFGLTGDEITFQQAFRRKFNYDEVVRTVASGTYETQTLTGRIEAIDPFAVDEAEVEAEGEENPFDLYET